MHVFFSIFGRNKKGICGVVLVKNRSSQHRKATTKFQKNRRKNNNSRLVVVESGSFFARIISCRAPNNSTQMFFSFTGTFRIDRKFFLITCFLLLVNVTRENLFFGKAFLSASPSHTLSVAKLRHVAKLHHCGFQSSRQFECLERGFLLTSFFLRLVNNYWQMYW